MDISVGFGGLQRKGLLEFGVDEEEVPTVAVSAIGWKWIDSNDRLIQGQDGAAELPEDDIPFWPSGGSPAATQDVAPCQQRVSTETE